MNITPVILCGGSGTRLWPYSRKAYPKQLLALAGEYSMLQETLLRLKTLTDITAPIIICNEEHRFIVAEQILEIGVEGAEIILEPCGKNTAPAAAIAALAAGKGACLFVLPADHKIENTESFSKAVSAAKRAAMSGHLVTFGVEATRPETGYGYIRKADQIENLDAFKVAEFVEKPQIEKAQEYIQQQSYYWNSGMFMFQSELYLQELERTSPAMLAACKQAYTEAKKSYDFTRLDKDAFLACPADSIDYAVMEKSNHVAVVPLMNSGWSDMGSWDAVYEAGKKNQDENVIRGEVFAENVKNSYLHAEDRLLAVVGVSDHIVIETADAVLVAHKSAAQDIKKMVQQLELGKRKEVDTHRRVHRPWGYYEVIDVEQQFQVKRITVKPGARLSLQMHEHRSEHWVVISGQADVVCGEREFKLDANQSTYIPMKTRHRLSNAGKEPLVIIEIQTGSYLGEDDIVRFDDVYDRAVETTQAGTTQCVVPIQIATSQGVVPAKAGIQGACHRVEHTRATKQSSILFASRSTPFHALGGMEAVSWDLAREFARKGVKVTFLTTELKDHPETFTVEGVNVIALKNTKPGKYSRSWWKRSREYFKQNLSHDVDAVLSVSAGAYGFLNKKYNPKRVPVYMQAHGTSVGEIKSKWRTMKPRALVASLRNIYAGIINTLYLNKFEKVIAIGDRVYQDLVHFPMTTILKKDKVVLIPNGVDTNIYKPDQALRQQTRASLNIDENAKVIISASRLHKQKGVEYSLKGFAEYAKREPNAIYLVLGDGPERSYLERLARELGVGDKVRFLGAIPRDDLNRYLNAADVFIFTTVRQEGLPLNVLEALAAGLRVVVSDLLSGSVKISEGMQCVSPHDTQLIARAFKETVKSHDRSSSLLPCHYHLDEMAVAYLRLLVSDNANEV